MRFAYLFIVVVWAGILFWAMATSAIGGEIAEFGLVGLLIALVIIGVNFVIGLASTVTMATMGIVIVDMQEKLKRAELVEEIKEELKADR